jgi:hypothetical protein
MLIIAQHLEFVKNQTEFHRKRLLKLGEKLTTQISFNAKKSVTEDIRLHERMSHSFAGLLDAMEQDIQAASTASKFIAPTGTSEKDDQLGSLLNQATKIIPTHLANLPQELLDQLQISDADRIQWSIVDLVDRTPDKTISIDVLLIALYRTTGKVHDRTDLSNRIWRLTRKQALFSVPGKKGWYTTIPQNEEPDLLSIDESEREL